MLNQALLDRFVPAVLIPGLDLRVGEAELGCQFQSVLDAQVFLALETLLQRLQLVVGEGRARLALLAAARRRRRLRRRRP